MSTIKKQSVQGVVLSYIGVVVGFISQGILIPNLLTKDENGLLGLLLSFMYIFVQIASLGFNSAGSRFFPYFYERKGYGGYLFLGISISLIGFGIGSFILEIIKPWILNSSGGNSSLLERYYYLLLPITLGTLLFNLFDNYSKNLFDSVTGTFLNQFLQRFIIVIGLVLIAVIGISFDAFIYIWVAAFIMPACWMIITAIRLGNFSLKPNFEDVSVDIKKQFVNYSLLTVLTGFSSMIIMYIDKIMLNHYSGLGDTGIYNTASFFGSIMGMSLVAMNKAASPVIVNAFKNNDLITIETVYRKSCIMQLIIGSLVYGGIIINLDVFFAFLPSGYEAGKWVIIILGFGKLIDLATGINGTILILSRYYKYDTIMMFTLILLTIISNMIFIPLYGLIGAAIAAALSTIYFNAVRFWLVWKKLGMQPINLQTFKVIGITIPIILIGYYLPHLKGNYMLLFLDIAYRSVFVTLFFIWVIYKSNVSLETNQLLDKGVEVVVNLLKIK